MIGVNPLNGSGREREREDGATANLGIVKPDPPGVCLDDPAGYRKPETGALCP